MRSPYLGIPQEIGYLSSCPLRSLRVNRDSLKERKALGHNMLLGTKTNNRRKPAGKEIRKTVKSIVMGMQRVEPKYFDQTIAVNPVTAGGIANISDITRGTDVTQRVGNQVFLKTIEFRCSASLNVNVTKAAIRYIIMIDKMGYNAPVASDVLETALLGTVYTDVSPYVWDYRKRFTILRDEVLSLTKGGPNEYVTRHFTLKLNTHSFHIGAATTFKNQVYILIVGAETNVLNLSTFQYNSRLVFTDE